MKQENEPLWALAAGCVPDAMPWDIPRIAAAAGFTSSGMWIDPATTWTGQALDKTRQALTDTGIQLIDAEVIWLDDTGTATDSQKLIVDVALELGARNVLVVSRHQDRLSAIRQFQELCELAGSALRVCLEFGEFTSIRSLASAREFISEADHPAAGILIDMMHLHRSGEPLPVLSSSLYPYVQACDFMASSGSLTGMDYIEAAVDGRSCLGEAEADAQTLFTICSTAIDVSLEIRSKPLREDYPDPFERARQIFNRCQRSAFT